MSKKNTKFFQGVFKPKHPEKYKGNPTNIIFRSQWEFKLMMELDHDSTVIEWQSEEKPIAYRSPVDGRIHRYFPDFIVKRKKSNRIITEMIEIKPFSQTKKPVKTEKKKQKTFLNEVVTYAINQAKWAAAYEYCKRHDIEFKIVTEKELFGTK